MEKLIVIAGCAGGCGKTMLTAALATEYARRGQSVCALDACWGRRGLDLMLNVQDRVVYDLADLANEDCTMEQTLVSCSQTDKLFLLAAPQQETANDLTGQQLTAVLKRLLKRFDVVIVDVNDPLEARAGVICRMASDVVLVAVPGDEAARNAEMLSSALHDHASASLWLLANRSDRRLPAEIQTPEALSAYLDVPLLAVLPSMAGIYSSALAHQPINDYPAPFLQSIRDAVGRLNGEEIPLQRTENRRFPWRSFIKG